MYFHACLETGLRQGLNIKISINEEKNSRQAVIPSGPSIENKYLANEELPVTDAIETKINSIGTKRFNISYFSV